MEPQHDSVEMEFLSIEGNITGSIKGSKHPDAIWTRQRTDRKATGKSFFKKSLFEMSAFRLYLPYLWFHCRISASQE